MHRSLRLLAATCVALLLSAISVHYFEEGLLPLVEVVRSAVYGTQLHTKASVGCRSLSAAEWVHPTALALTVYGDVQSELVRVVGSHGPEVLPKYAEDRAGADELKCVADYLLNAAERRVIVGLEVLRFPFEIEYESYNLKSGWTSGLTQALVGQVFLGAYLQTGDDRYVVAARQAGNLLRIPIVRGGVKVHLPNGNSWYAEYAQRGSEPPFVLNGHLLALDFLYWMGRIDPRGYWSRMFESGLEAVVLNIGHHRGMFWSYYDQQGNLATRKYQTFHVRQLERYAMHDETGTLQAAANEMRLQLHIPMGIFQRLVMQPSRLLAFLMLLFFVIYFPVVWLAWRRLAVAVERG